jgi:hypothetical protein
VCRVPGELPHFGLGLGLEHQHDLA